jgi:hypothetical protein
VLGFALHKDDLQVLHLGIVFDWNSHAILLHLLACCGNTMV